MSQKKFNNAKIVVLGGPGVGKTAFTVRYITKRYIGDYDRNKEMMYTYKISAPKEDIQLEILDTAQNSQEVCNKHIKWGDGFVFIYSVTDVDSFREACRLKDIILKLKGSETPIVLIANKCDMLSARCVTEDDGASLAAQLDCPKFDLSVAEGYQGVSEAMEELLIQLKRNFVKNLTASAQSGEKPRSKLFNMRKVLKKRIGRSHSDTF
ncbi:unnamed protein product [Mytilus coruscus]|uniref:small monomeric GTPase n=1 Tax=Mytilus coruscus TaxID=42192 RepID=A0A6J8ARA7_MYTCO|nr:unnamed protein product [Mytilus coruscus]